MSKDEAYEWLLNGGKYEAVNEEQTVVSNPSVVKEPTAQATTYNISLPLDVIADPERSVEMVDTLSQILSK